MSNGTYQCPGCGAIGMDAGPSCTCGSGGAEVAPSPEFERLLAEAVEAELLVDEHRALYIAAQNRAEMLFRDALKLFGVPPGTLDKSDFWSLWLQEVRKARAARGIAEGVEQR